MKEPMTIITVWAKSVQMTAVSPPVKQNSTLLFNNISFASDISFACEKLLKCQWQLHSELGK